MSWPTVPLKRVASIRISNVDKKSVDGQTPVRLCNYTDVYYRQQIDPIQDFMSATATADQIAEFRLKAGDVVITKDSETANDIGVPTFVSQSAPDLVCGYHLAILRPTSRLNGRYLHWAISSRDIQTQFEVSATGITRFGLRSDAIGETAAPLPPLSAQQAIAEFLDAETARIDSLISKNLRLLQAIEQREWTWRSILIVGADSPDVDSVAELGRVSSKFPTRRLHQVVPDIGVGVVVSPSSYFTAEGVPFIHGSNIKDGSIDLTGVRRISVDDSARLARSRLAPGDVLVVRAGYPGRAAVVPTELEGANCASVLILRKSPEVLPAFLAAYFNSAPARQQIQASQYGAAQEQVNVGHVVDFKIALPDLVTQQQIVDRLSESSERYHRLGNSITANVELLRERRRALITTAVTGQVAVPGVEAA